MKNINIDYKYLFLIIFILILALIPTYAHHGDIIVDCGREVYYPTQILLGKVLYKDIFNIYGPFSYMLNAFLFKIFGINLNVLYVVGCLCAFCVSILIYLISKRFLSKFLSFSISIFTIAIGVLNTHLFNFVFPYSFAILYGIVSFLVSLWFLLKYQENSEKNFYLYASSFFAGICVTSKYEFLPYLIAILYAMLKIKPLKFKEYYLAIVSLFFVPIICFGTLFLQGMKLSDIVSAVFLIKKMAQSQSLAYFYTGQGIYFCKNTIPFLISAFLFTAIPLGFFVYGFRLKNKVLSSITILLSVILISYWTTPVIFAFLPILIAILAIFDYKKLVKNVPLMILTLATFAVSMKIFWGLITQNYGAFFASFLLITFLSLMLQRFKNVNQNAIGAYIIIVSIALSFQVIPKLLSKNHLISTERGKIYTYGLYYKATDELINYIKSNTKKSDKIVILPEGVFINFLTNRQSDDVYNSLIPLYVEVFGEENIIQHFRETKPEYIVFNNFSTDDYYFKGLCYDYAISLCSYVNNNYIKEKTIDYGFKYLIFKRR